MPEAGEVRFYYDVVCPYSYMESHVVEQAEDSGRASVTWLPFELRPAPRPLLDPRGDHLRVDWTRTVYQRAQALGVEIHLPRYQPRSTLALAACLWADDQGSLRPFRRALYEAFFCEGRDIGSDAEIAAPPTSGPGRRRGDRGRLLAGADRAAGRGACRGRERRCARRALGADRRRRHALGDGRPAARVRRRTACACAQPRVPLGLVGRGLVARAVGPVHLRGEVVLRVDRSVC